MASGRRDTVGHPVPVQLLQHLAHPVDRPQLTPKSGEHTPVKRLVEIPGQTTSRPLQHKIVNTVDGGAHVVANRLLVRGRMPQLAQILGEYTIGDRLAVHQHTVVVEHDHVIAAHAPTVRKCREAPLGWDVLPAQRGLSNVEFGGVLLSHTLPHAVPSAQ
jgi:hypothetical protein